MAHPLPNALHRRSDATKARMHCSTRRHNARRHASRTHPFHWLPQVLGLAVALVLLIGVVVLVRAHAGVSAPASTTTGNIPLATGTNPTTTGAAPTSASSSQPVAPDFTLATLNGTPFQLANQRGHVVVLYFMATTCGTCAQGSYDVAQAVLAAQTRGAEAVAIDLNPGDSATALRAFAQAAGVPAQAPVIWGVDATGAIARAYRVQALETTVVIDPSGHIAVESLNPIPPQQLAQLVRSLA
jgi:peroxiredoxin